MILSSKVRLIAALSVILVIAFVSISIINYRTTRYAVRKEIVFSSLPLLRENIYSEIQRDFIPSINRASLMANNTFLKDWTLNGEENAAEAIDYLREIQSKYNYFSTFFVSDQSKKYYHYSGVLKEVSRDDAHDSWYFNFKESGREFDLDVDTNEAADNLLTIFINYRVEDAQGNFLGVTGVGIKMNNFTSTLRAKQEKYDRTIFLIDETGTVQAHPDNNLVGTISLRDKPGIRQIADKILTKNEEPVNESYHYNNDTMLVTSRYMPNIEWYLIVEQDESEALASARSNFIRTIFIGLATSIIIIVILIITINHFQTRLERLAVTDELTNTANRREFHTQLERRLARYDRFKTPVSIIILDLDHFKEINDRRGHLQGDKVLKECANILQENIRPIDLLARWGGDEFVMLLECPLDEARQSAERLRAHLKAAVIKVSMGITEYLGSETIDSFIARADSALYKSKQAGRDRISIQPA